MFGTLSCKTASYVRKTSISGGDLRTGLPSSSRDVYEANYVEVVLRETVRTDTPMGEAWVDVLVLNLL